MAITILAVDDQEVNLRMLEALLKKEGFAFAGATGGDEALKMAGAAPPDLILLDLYMPGNDGYWVIEHLKKSPRLSSIPVIFLTSETDVAAKVRGFDLGAVDYIVKPFKPDEVRARVRVHLRLAAALKALIAQQTEQMRALHSAQQSMLITPEQLPDAGFDVFFEPLHSVGGDLYDVVRLGPQHYGFFICDVSGHDLGSSLITSYVKALLKANCTIYNEPSQSMNIINRVLCDILQPSQYLTGIYLRLNRATGEAQMVSMGHPPAVMVSAEGVPVFIDRKGPPLGIQPQTFYTTHSVHCKQGATIVLYTDGLIEHCPVNKKPSRNKERLIEVLSGLDCHTEDHLPRVIYERMKGGGEEATDDVLILTLRV